MEVTAHGIHPSPSTAVARTLSSRYALRVRPHGYAPATTTPNLASRQAVSGNLAEHEEPAVAGPAEPRSACRPGSW
jgi:hypothetical protein